MPVHAICFYKPKGGSLTAVVFWCISECVRQNKNRMSKYGRVFPLCQITMKGNVKQEATADS